SLKKNTGGYCGGRKDAYLCAPVQQEGGRFNTGRAARKKNLPRGLQGAKRCLPLQPLPEGREEGQANRAG
ncbi:hypothetical protein ACFSKU_21810, partial [Pontibacter silvestris]